VAFSPFLTHYNEEIYPDPSRYDPERFTDLERKLFLTSNRHFVQFGAGVHKCPVPHIPTPTFLITMMIVCSAERGRGKASVVTDHVSSIGHQGERFANLVIKSTLSLVLRSSQFELVGAELQPPDYQKQAGTPSPGMHAHFCPIVLVLSDSPCLLATTLCSRSDLGAIPPNHYRVGFGAALFSSRRHCRLPEAKTKN
jgi:hypothetical protein